jgi:hypothetical protein
VNHAQRNVVVVTLGVVTLLVAAVFLVNTTNFLHPWQPVCWDGCTDRKYFGSPWPGRFWGLAILAALVGATAYVRSGGKR